MPVHNEPFAKTCSVLIIIVVIAIGGCSGEPAGPSPTETPTLYAVSSNSPSPVTSYSSTSSSVKVSITGPYDSKNFILFNGPATFNIDLKGDAMADNYAIDLVPEGDMSGAISLINSGSGDNSLSVVIMKDIPRTGRYYLRSTWPGRWEVTIAQ